VIHNNATEQLIAYVNTQNTLRHYSSLILI